MLPTPPIHFEGQTNHKEFSDSLYKVLNGNISFGDGVNSDNMDGAWGADAGGNYLITMPAVANTAITITHNLNRIPKFYDVKYKDRSCDIYDSGVAWTKNTISVKCTVVSAKVRLWIH